MKLRNKKTGEIGEFMGTYNAVPFIGIGIDYHDGNPVKYEYNTLTELNDEWEDVKEPLVEGKSQRAVLRAAARLSGTDVATVLRSDVAGIVVFDFRGQCRVELKDRGINIKNRGAYTIIELCGEEEE